MSRWLSVSLFVLGLIVLDRSAGATLWSVGPRVASDTRFARLSDGRVDAAWVVVGSSRAARDVDATALGAALGAPAYNLGVPGTSVALHREVVRLAVARDASLRGVVWVVDDPNELSGEGLFFIGEPFVPASRDPLVADALVRHGQRNPWFARVSSAYAARGWIDLVLKELFRGRVSREIARVREDGSMPLGGRSVTWDGLVPRAAEPYDRRKEVPDRVADARALVAEAKPVRLVAVLPPNFDPPSPGFADRIRELGVPTLDYSAEPHPKTDFYDRSHLGADAAARFSARLGEDLR